MRPFSTIDLEPSQRVPAALRRDYPLRVWECLADELQLDYVYADQYDDDGFAVVVRSDRHGAPPRLVAICGDRRQEAHYDAMMEALSVLADRRHGAGDTS